MREPTLQMERRRSRRTPVKLDRKLGSLQLTELQTGNDLLRLFNAMNNDPNAAIDGFRHMFGTLLDWWKYGGRLYVACCEETDAMFECRVDTSMFINEGGFPWILPAFVAASGPGQPIDLLWVHSSLRRRGIGTAMVKLSPFTLPKQTHILPGARRFWARLGAERS